MTNAKDKKGRDDYEKALSVFDQAIKAFRKEEGEKFADLFSTFQEKYSGESELIDRMRIYQSILERKTKKAPASLKSFDDYYLNAVFRLNQGEFTEAEKLLAKAQQMEPKEGRVLYLMSVAALRSAKDEEALGFLKRAVELDGSFSTLAQNDPEFDSMKDNEDFQSIIGSE